MKRFASLLVVLLLSSAPAAAANHYVWSGSTASSPTGADWTQAYASLPASLTRGDTYFVAAGAYDAHTFNDPDNGSTPILIKAATQANAGSVAGWTSSLDACAGNGPATFEASVAGSGNVWSITTDYYGFDGECGVGKTHGYGLYVSDVNMHLGGPGSHNLVFFSGTHDQAFRHIELEGFHQTLDTQTIETLFYGTGGPYNIVLQYSYLHGGAGPVLLRGTAAGGGANVPGDNIVIDHVQMWESYSSPANHSEACSCSGGLTNVWWTNNVMGNIGNTAAGFATPTNGHPNPPPLVNGPIYIFGNVETCTAASPNCHGASVMDFLDFGAKADIVVAYNTFYDILYAGEGLAMKWNDGSFSTYSANIYFENNLYLEESTASVVYYGPYSLSGTETRDYNSYYDTAFYNSSFKDPGSHSTFYNAPTTGIPPLQGANDLTVDGHNLNFNLKRDTDPADTALLARVPVTGIVDIHVDPEGRARTTSRGAYQFGPVPDGGTAAFDAGTGDAGGPSDAGTGQGQDSGSAVGEAGTNDAGGPAASSAGTTTGCGCTVTRSPRARCLVVLGLLTVSLLRRRARRPRGRAPWMRGRARSEESDAPRGTLTS